MFPIFWLFMRFLFSNSVPLSGSLKRPVSSHPMSSHLRVLQSPLTSGLNPEGIYVWDPSNTLLRHCCLPSNAHIQPPPPNLLMCGNRSTGYLSSTLLCTVVSITWRRQRWLWRLGKWRNDVGSHWALNEKQLVMAWREKHFSWHVPGFPNIKVLWTSLTCPLNVLLLSL